MRILIDIGHPAHVHLFKNFIWEMENKGHTFLVTARKKEVSHDLLRKYGIPFTSVGIESKGKFALIKEWIQRDFAILNLARSFRPDMLIGMGNPCIAHVGTLLRRPSIIVTDTEHAKTQNSLSFPFCSAILTPSCYREDVGPKQVRYNGYHELAYLHPNRFTPDPSILEELGLTPEDRFIIVRFVAWQADHDVGYDGLTLENKRRAIREFEKYGRVFISSEKVLPDEFEKYRLSITHGRMQDLLSYATLLYGESATMASECAVLGTHAIFCDYAGRGYTDEEESRYDLVFNFELDESSQERSIQKAVELLQEPNLKEIGRQKQSILLKEKIDVTEFLVWFAERYPESAAQLKEDPAIQERFR